MIGVGGCDTGGERVGWGGEGRLPWWTVPQTPVCVVAPGHLSLQGVVMELYSCSNPLPNPNKPLN